MCQWCATAGLSRLSRTRASDRRRDLCQGRAVPELVYAEDRVLYPMVRTRPKGDPDPGWQRVMG